MVSVDIIQGICWYFDENKFVAALLYNYPVNSISWTHHRNNYFLCGNCFKVVPIFSVTTDPGRKYSNFFSKKKVKRKNLCWNNKLSSHHRLCSRFGRWNHFRQGFVWLFQYFLSLVCLKNSNPRMGSIYYFLWSIESWQCRNNSNLSKQNKCIFVI